MNLRYITKNRNKHKEKYNLKKLRKSLKRSGANNVLTSQILEEIEACYDSETISSNKIHDLALKILRRKSPIIAANYSLKRGLEKLGPSGYAFEVLCSEILKSRGYKTKVGVTLKGKFVTHEVDVLGVRGDRTIMCECKYHNSAGHKNNVKIPLYIDSRARDINANKKSPQHDQFIIFSNTKFTLDAQRYAEGVGMKLISLMDNDDNVIDYIKRYKIYPVTCLKNLKRKEQQLLLSKSIVTIQHLQKKINKLTELGFGEDRIIKIKNEIKLLKQSK